MGIFKSVKETKSGLKVLAFGKTGKGKTYFALTFPAIAAIDSEDGMAWYKRNKNLIQIANTTSAEDIEEALEEIESNDAIKTFVIDSETKIYENLQFGGLNVAEKRARQKGQSVDDANLSQREWGKIKLVTKKLQSTKIMLASKGVNIVSVAQEKDIKEKKGDNWITVGCEPDTAKGFEYDYDIVIRLFTEKDEKTKEELYKGEILKDRTGTFKKGEIVSNPSFEYWKDIYEYQSKLEEQVVDFRGDIKKDESKLASELEKLDDLVKKFKTKMAKLSKENQLKVGNKLKELQIDNPLKTDDTDGMTKIIEFIEAL